MLKNLQGYIPWKCCVLQILQNKLKNYYSFQGCSIIIWLDHMVLIFENSNATACYLIFFWKLKRCEIIFRYSLKLLKQTDFQTISWQNLKLKFEIWNLQFEIKKDHKNITIQKSFRSILQEYSSYLELLLLVSLPSLF